MHAYYKGGDNLNTIAKLADSIVNNHYFTNGNKSTASAIILQISKNTNLNLQLTGNELMQKMMELEKTKTIEDLAQYLQMKVGN